jgi:hypothetical protein
MLRLRFTGTFKRDRKRAGRRGKPLDKLDDLMRRLANEEKLEAPGNGDQQDAGDSGSCPLKTGSPPDFALLLGVPDGREARF